MLYLTKLWILCLFIIEEKEEKKIFQNREREILNEMYVQNRFEMNTQYIYINKN